MLVDILYCSITRISYDVSTWTTSRSLGSFMLLQMAEFYFSYGWVIFHCIYYIHNILLIQPSVHGHSMGCFLVLTIVNSALKRHMHLNAISFIIPDPPHIPKVGPYILPKASCICLSQFTDESQVSVSFSVPFIWPRACWGSFYVLDLRTRYSILDRRSLQIKCYNDYVVARRSGKWTHSEGQCRQ